ncbi:phage portal protein [Listeria monocytogenes]|uniref:phage portal protein n=1 Tax=Listeria monocytogenes TaxID=1639 RepID=UPI0011EB35AC|nr:phage portal protein [Listeria monocytogenes]TYU82179.1 phage portal protein [Listeria monocytogenes]
MEIEVIKKIIKENLRGFPAKVARIKKAERYYQNENDILRRRNPVEEKLKEKDSNNPLRNADNRISHPWHWLLVDQKAAYTMTVPPTFDVDDDDLNKEITKLLGDSFPKIAKDLCVNASNAGVAWLHIWKDEDHQNFFKYAVIDSKQIIPVYSKRLDNKLEGILRVYEDYNDSGDVVIIYEYWNDKECSAFYRLKNKTVDDLEEYSIFDMYDVGTGEKADSSNTYTHDWEAIPFIPFRNNPSELSDLKKYKKLIDVYDKVYSGFVNDLDDIQEIIFVLTNYGGEDKQEFLDDLRKYKVVKVENDEQGIETGVDTLAIEIPIDARNKILEITHDSIFLQGQGVDPQKNIGQNNSGAALEYMYSLLELKASMLETEFRQGFAELVRFILKYSNEDADVRIEQKWTRTSIKDDGTMADIIAKLASTTSQEAIARNNPLVEDAEKELAALKQEKEDEFRGEDNFRNPNPPKKDVTEDVEE